MAIVRNNPKLIEQFALALEQKDKKEVSRLLTSSLLNETDDHKQNIVHIAAQYADESTFEIVINFVVKNKKKELLNQQELSGKNPLHIAALFNDDKVVKK